MDHKTFIHRLASATGLPAERTEQMAASLATAIRQACAAGDTVAIPSFGSLSPVKTDEYVVDNLDGSRTLMPPHVSVEFAASAVLRKAISHKQ